MSQQYIGKRIVFPTGEQKAFLVSCRATMNVTWSDIAQLLRLHPRTVRDWAREKNRMPYSAAKRLARKTATTLPKNTKILTWREHLRRAGKAGGKAAVRKNGGRVVKDEKHRLRKWQEWWEKVGRHQLHPIINKPLPIQKPRQSESLAEFVGIMIGDGGISPWQVVVTLHRFDDKEFSQHVRKLITKLFGVIPGTHESRDALADDIVVSRVELVRFCVTKLGLKLGNKVRQKVDIPLWIKKNKKYLRACVRGLVDTDGSVFTHQYRVKGKLYRYKKLSFTSASKPLRQSVFETLLSWKLHPRLSGNRDVRLDSQKDMRKYFAMIGSHNQKHLNHYQQ